VLYQWWDPFLPIAALASFQSLDAFRGFFSNNTKNEIHSKDICITALDFCDSWAERKTEPPVLTTPSIRAHGSCTHSP
jgi:hypothetical protein